jgi:hypothetical protein
MTYTITDHQGGIIETGWRYQGTIIVDGRRLFGLPEWRLPEYRHYPEVRANPRPYDDGYESTPVIIDDEARYERIIPDAETRRQRALDALAPRIQAERDRRVSIVTTGLEPDDDMYGDRTARKQREALMQVQAMARREYLGYASQDDIDTIEMMAAIPQQVHDINIHQAELTQWARDNLPDWQAVDAFDPSTPPQEAPQWPSP